MNQNQPQNPYQPTAPPPKKKRSWWKTCGLIVLIFILLLGGGYGYLTYRFRTAKDIPSVNDSDLLAVKVNIPDEENSYFELAKIKDVISYPTDEAQLNKINDMLDNKSWDEAYVKDLIAKNEQALIYLDAADKKPKFVDPATADPSKLDVNTLTTIGSSIRNIARIQSLKSLLLLKESNNEQAFDESLKILRLSNKLNNYQPTLIQYLLGLAAANIGWSRLDTIVSTGGLSSEFLQGKKAELEKLKSTKEGLEIAMKLEYMIFANSFSKDMVASQEEIQKAVESNVPLEKMAPSFYFEPNKTKQEYANSYREMIRQINKTCGETVTPTNINIQSKYTLLFTENAIGKILLSMTMTSLTNIHDKRCKTENLAEQVINKLK